MVCFDRRERFGSIGDLYSELGATFLAAVCKYFASRSALGAHEEAMSLCALALFGLVRE